MVCRVTGGQHHKNSHNCNFLRGLLSNVCSSSDTPCCYETKKEKWITKKGGGGGTASILPQYSHVRKVSRRQFFLDTNWCSACLLPSLRLRSLIQKFSKGFSLYILNRHEFWKVRQSACPYFSRWSWCLHLFFGRPLFPLSLGLYLSAYF
jgi:hypothetical protein